VACREERPTHQGERAVKALLAVAVAVLAASAAQAETCFSDFASPLAVQSIKDVQEQLAKKGYRPGKPDGQLGPRTCRAVLAFQKDAGMAADGRVDQKLQNELHFGRAPEPKRARR
jgi:peptidoglycan hydrolase-like protein with peptidoglycan-binding domain